jgi:transcriptional regulator with XRE-family HTH domain
MAASVSAARRREIDRIATEVRMDGLRRGLTIEETASRILRTCPEVLPLEAWRLAHGWTRSEVSARLDLLYTSDGLAPINVDQATLCRWEHGDRRPGQDRIDYLCRLYRTRPDRIGFGTDHGPGDADHVRATGIIDAFPFTCEDSEQDLLTRIGNARHRINLFGLTRNFYAHESALPVVEAKAAQVPIQVFLMDPYCQSRKDRYRLEPSEAAMESPDRYVREILRPLALLAERLPKLSIFTFNFPCSFAIEEIDDACRVMLYGHGKRGTQGPIITYAADTSAHAYFVDQIRWLERLTTEPDLEPWASKGILVRPLTL